MATDLSVDARLLATEPDRDLGINRGAVVVATMLLLGGTLALAAGISWRQGLLYLLGGALGVTLYHALFGFTSAWRVFIADRRGAGLRAQMVMLAVAVVLFFPALAHGTLFGAPVHGEYGAVGVGMITGAFLFGLGMQLGGGCASGTLYTAGGGNTRMLVTLAAFVAGSALGAKHLPWWTALPNIGAVPMIATLGWVEALILNLAVIGLIYVGTVVLERRRHGCAGRRWRGTQHREAGAVSSKGRGRWCGARCCWRCSISRRFTWPDGPGALPRASRCGARRSSPRPASMSPPGPIGRAGAPSRCERACSTTSPR